MKKLGIIALILLAVLTVVGVVIWAAGPSLIATEVEEELSERFERRDIDAQWTSFEAGFGGEFVMRDATFTLSQLGVELEADRIVVRVDPTSALDDTPRIEGAELSGVQIRADLAALDSETEESTPTAGAERSSGLLRSILEAPPAITLTNARLDVVRGDLPIAIATADSADFEPIERGWNLVARGASQVRVDAVPEVFREEVPWDLQASLKPLDLLIEFRLSGPGGKPLIAVEEEQLVRAEVGAVSGRIDIKRRSAQTELKSVTLRLGPKEAPGIAFAVDRTRVDVVRDRIEMVAARSPRVTLTPSKFGPVREGLSWLRALAGRRNSTAPKTDDDSTFVPLRYRVSDAFRRATGIAATTDIYIEGLSLGVKLESAVGTSFDTITLLETLDAQAVDGAVSIDGRTAGGLLLGKAQLVPGSMWPLYLEGSITDVKLEEMPGMPKKRSELPSRGTSGRVGGELDAVFAATFPTLGSDGPLLQSMPSFVFGSFDWADGVIDLTGVSDEPLEGIDLSFDFVGRGYPSLNDFDVMNATLRYGPAVLQGRGSFTDAPLDPTFTVWAQLEEIACQKLFRAAPVGLLGPYRAVEMEGEWAPKFYMRLPLFRPRGFRMKVEEYEDLCSITDLRTYNKWLPKIRVKESPPTAPHLHARALPEEKAQNPRWDDVHWLNAPFVKRVTEGVSSEDVVVNVGPGLTSYVPLHEMPGYVGGAAYLSEEMDFYDDGPINLNLISKAVRLNLEKGRFQYGGSTVTQQLVKNLFLTRDKTFARKFQEALVAWRITEAVSKKRVLELYLNCIEYGPDVYGIGPAAQFYFQKDARLLTAKEAIFLAMLKPAPWYGAKVIERGKTPVSGWWAGRYEELYQRLIDYGYMTATQAEAEKPYFLEWDDDGQYVPAASESIPEFGIGDDLIDLLDVDPQ